MALYASHRMLAVRVVRVALVLLALGSVFGREAVAAEWQELPVVPALGPVVAGHLEKVASRGERFGNRPGVVAKIGDSITASPSFLQALACSPAELGPYEELRGTLGFFGRTPVPSGSEEAQCPVSNSYSRLGAAAVGGWRAADALLSRESFPECQGLPAVSCELQLIHPSVALIMFGTNDLKVISATRFRLDLARVVRRVSSAGTIPVISTIPPRATQPFSQRVARFNAEIAALAENRALPLWNYWRQMVEPGASPLGPESRRRPPECSLPTLHSDRLLASGTATGVCHAQPRRPARPRSAAQAGSAGGRRSVGTGR